MPSSVVAREPRPGRAWIAPALAGAALLLVAVGVGGALVVPRLLAEPRGGSVAAPRIAPAGVEPSAEGPGVPAVASGAGAAWQPIVCDRPMPDVEGVVIDAGGGNPLLAAGSCELRLRNCTIRGVVGIQATGNARIRLDDCRVEGQLWGMSTTAGARVEMHGGSIRGQIGAAHAAGSSFILLSGTTVTGMVGSSEGGRLQQDP